jgi:hypothetical protein
LSEPERRDEKREHSAAPYITTALGFAFLIAAVLVVLTAGVPAAGFPFVLAAAALLGVGISGFVKQRHALPSPVNKERELLSAIRDSGGSITPAEAAMGTSLTVREADALLSELASSGHLRVESEGGTLFYALPGKRAPELGSSTSG